MKVVEEIDGSLVEKIFCKILSKIAIYIIEDLRIRKKVFESRSSIGRKNE